MIDKKALRGIGIMRRFRYDTAQVLKMVMLAAGGVLILAAAGKYEKELDKGQGREVWERYGRDLMAKGGAEVFWHGFPGTVGAREGGSKGSKAGSWTEWMFLWLEERDPRVRFERSRTVDRSGDGYKDPDPSFGTYLDSQRAVMESSYLLFGGGEETNTDKADMAGGYVPDGDTSQTVGEVALQELPEATVVHHENRNLPVVGTRSVLEQLADYDFLMKNFYSVHSSTTASREEMDAGRLLGEDLRLNTDGDDPQILIYHTHSQETFADYGADRPQATVVGIGDYLTELLEAKGYRVIHDTSIYDLVDGELDRSRAYDHALKGVTAILQENPSIEVVLDVHRDGVREDLHMVSQVNGKPTAPIMFFNGMSQTPEGPIEYLANPYKEQNLAFSLQMQLDAAAYFPGFTRKIYLKAFRYNLHLRPRSALIEVGAQTNTYEEARNAMEPLAEILDMVLAGEE